MSKKMILIIFIMILICQFVYSKRMAPKAVKPVIYKGIKYTSPHDKMGFVVALDVKTGDILWEKKIYNIIYNPILEGDVQDVFITKLKIINNFLVITNEKNNKYKLNLKTLKVTKIKS